MSLLGGDDLQTSVRAPVVGPDLALIKTSPYKQAAWMGVLTGQGQIPGTEGKLEVEARPWESSILSGPYIALFPLTRAHGLGQQSPESGIPSLHIPNVKSHAGCRTTSMGLAAFLVNPLNRFGNIWLLARE